MRINSFKMIRNQIAQRLKKRLGFTLIELMIVVSIIGILASIAIPKFSEMVRKSKEGALKGNLGSLRSALNIYYADMEGYYPSDYGYVGGGGVGLGAQYLIVSLIHPAGKYINSFPHAMVPDYHPAGSGMGGMAGSDTDVMNAPTIAAGFAAAGDCVLTGAWLYFADPTQPATWGQVFVYCTHTDTKGTVWSSY